MPNIRELLGNATLPELQQLSQVRYAASFICISVTVPRCRLHRHLESATAMPFSDNGTEFSSSDASATASYFPLVLNLLSATQSANTEVGPTLEE